MHSDFDEFSDIPDLFSSQSSHDTYLSLTTQDNEEYNRLKESFNLSQQNRHSYTFQQEINKILMFVDRSSKDREQRAIAAGLFYSGSYFCVNTQQLKKLICRCKSSINNGFQQLGYTTIKIKPRVSFCLKNSLPSVANNPVLSRQWTVRTYLSDVLAQQIMKINYDAGLKSSIGTQRQKNALNSEINMVDGNLTSVFSIPHFNCPSSAPLQKKNEFKTDSQPTRDMNSVQDFTDYNDDIQPFGISDDFNDQGFW